MTDPDRTVFDGGLSWEIARDTLAVLTPTEAAVSTTHHFDEWAYDHNCVICRRPRSEHPTEAAGWVCANCQQENQAANFRCWACQWDKPATEAAVRQR